MKKYGLEVDGKLLGFATSSNDGDCCVDVAYELETMTENVWLVDDKAIAEKVATSSPSWYNAGYEYPINNYIGKCKVVEVKLSWKSK